MSGKRIGFIVRGAYYETLESTLERYPETLLGSRSKRQALQSLNSDVILLQCNAVAFDAILFYYQSNGILIRPPSFSVAEFEEICQFFAIAKVDINRMKERDGFIVDEEERNYEFHSNVQQSIWQFLENPRSSRVAGIYGYAIYCLIFSSVLIGCFQTLPELKRTSSLSTVQNSLSIFDIFVNLFFLLELIIRFFISPQKLRFFTVGVNFIDLISIVPFLILEFHYIVTKSFIDLLHMVKTFRVLRLLRVRRQSKRLQVAFKILSGCITDVITMVSAVAVSSLGYASILFFVEQAKAGDTQFDSIPSSLWWAVQTIIPLGYGDIIPRSIYGKFAAGIVCILAAFSFTVPVLFLGGKFLALYSKSFSMTLGSDFKNFDEEVN